MGCDSGGGVVVVQIDDKVIEKQGVWKVIKIPYGKDSKKSGQLRSLWMGPDDTRQLTLAPTREACFPE